METFVEGFHDAEAVKRMPYNKLGNTDMVVSKVGIGRFPNKVYCIQYWENTENICWGGGPFGDIFNACNQEVVDYIVEKGMRNGMNYIDTAYWYGQGKSEERISNVFFFICLHSPPLFTIKKVRHIRDLQVLSKIPRSAYYISTKVGRYEPKKLHMFDFRGDKAIQSVENSLIRLKLPSVDIVQVKNRS